MLHKVRHYDLGTGINSFPTTTLSSTTTQKGHNSDHNKIGHNSDQRRKEHSMSFLKDVYSAIVMVMKHTEAYDSDGDGMIENSGFPDQTYVYTVCVCAEFCKCIDHCSVCCAYSRYCLRIYNICNI